MRFTTVSLVLLLAASCGNSTTYVLRVRDSSARSKPNSLFGKILAVDAGPVPVLVFGGTQVGAEWTEDATTVTTDVPASATAYSIVGWLELDGKGDNCAKPEDPCEPTAGDAVIRTQVAAASTVVFLLDFK
jgi:hypothetical protein